MNPSRPGRSDDLIQTRRSLLERLKDRDDSRSWVEFFELYWRLIYNVARQFGMSEDEAKEIVQETMISVSRNIMRLDYNPARGAFKNWLLKMTRWRMIDRLRKRKKEEKNIVHPSNPEDDGPRTSTVDRVADPNDDGLDAVWEKEWQRNLVELATRQVKGRVNPRDYQIFHCSVVKEYPVAKVSEMFEVSAGQVYVIKSRISSLIKKEVRKLEQQPEATHEREAGS